jgi:hypothetical protein
MIVTDDIFVMLLTEEKFKTFTPNQICDAKKYTEALVCLSLESRAKVDEMVGKAIAAGGATYNEPQDHGFMYGHGFSGSGWAHLGTYLLYRAKRNTALIPDSTIERKTSVLNGSWTRVYV